MNLVEQARTIKSEVERVKKMSMIAKPAAIEAVMDDVIALVMDMAIELDVMNRHMGEVLSNGEIN